MRLGKNPRDCSQTPWVFAMKKCPYCGLESPDSAVECPTCQTSLQTEEPIQTITPVERRFWQYLTLRQLALLMVRLQGIWFLLHAAAELTYLPRYLGRWGQGATYYAIEGRRDLALFALRVIIYVAAAMALLLYGERLLSLLVKDLIAKEGLPPSSEATPPKIPSPK